MKISLSTSLHLDHGTISLDAPPGTQPPMQSFVPIGLLSLKAAVDRAALDAQVRVIEINGLINDGLIRNDDHFYDNICDAILEPDDRFVGLMTDADSLPHTVLTALHVKRRSPQTLVCLGGPAATPISRLLLERFPFIDFVVRGEAEETLVELLAELEMDRKPEQVRGLTWRDVDAVRSNGERPVIEDVNNLPLPSFEAYDMAAGAPLYLDVGRGCPFKCRFCATAPFWDRRYRMKSIDRILQEMTLIRDTYGRNHLNFSHDIFTCDKKWTHAFCERLIGEQTGMTWTCSTRTDIIDPHTLEMMSQAGCVEIYYGIESGSDATQSFIDKGLDLDWSREIVRATAAAGIRPVTGFIIGHPTETRESLRDTLDKFFDFLQVGKFRAHLFTLCPFHEAPLFREYEQTISRPSECADISQTAPVAAQVEQLRHAHPDVFASSYRFDTPSVAAGLVDATEEISCHLVLLKSLWPLLLPYYTSTLDWYERWVEWIERYNQKHRPGSPLRHQGNAYDILQFVTEELTRLHLSESDIADLVHYEEAKLDARTLADPLLPSRKTATLTGGGLIARRCTYQARRFRHDLKPLLSGQRTDRFPDNQESWVVFAKTAPSYVDTLQTTRLGKQILELTDQPQEIERLLARLHSAGQIEQEHSYHIIQQFYDRGLLCEVIL